MIDELLDIVDHNDFVIGQQQRSHVYAQKSNNFRVINAFVINSQGQLWIPRRAANKKLFPLCLDASVGGHVSAGETYEQAFVRETQEELNIDIATVQHQMVAKLTPHKHGVSAFMQVYIINTDTTPQYNPDDFVSATWFELSELQRCITQGEPTKGDLPKLINLLHNLRSCVLLTGRLD